MISDEPDYESLGRILPGKDEASHAMSQPPPEGLPQEFNEDWKLLLAAEKAKDVRFFQNDGPTLQYCFERYRAALEHDAKVCTRLRERVEQCNCPKGDDHYRSRKCEQCRLDLALLEGQK